MHNAAPVVILVLGGLAALYPQPMAWVFVAAFMLFEFWLVRRLGREGGAPPPTGEPPYHFTEEEARLVARFRFYFADPRLARTAASMLAALGLASLVLSPWLVFRGALLPAALVGMNLLAIGSLTRRLVPVMVLRIAASKGDRDALRQLELHDPLWEKIRAANAGR